MHGLWKGLSFSALLLATASPLNAAAQSAPYSGTPLQVPAIFEAEHFDRGGQGVAYHDNVAGNADGQYRPSEDVDIIGSSDSAGGGYVVNHFETGEWLAYTINVPTGGNYDIELRAASTFNFSAFHLEVDGVKVTGSVLVPNTGGWSAFQWIDKKGVALTAGQHVLKIVADQQYFDLNSIRVTASAAAPLPTTGIAAPGTFEAENFDRGGEGVGYHDNVPGNLGGQYRPSEDVDIILSSDSAGGSYVVNNFETGEWLAYTLNVASTAKYDLELRVSSAFSNSAFHAEIDGVNVTGPVPVPNTGAWNAFQSVGKKGVALTAGTHVLKIVSDQQYFNLNSLRLTLSADQQTPSIPGNLAARSVSPSQIDLSWSAATDNVGVTGYYVYRNGVQVSKVSGTAFSDTGLSPATTYSYAVAAYDATENVSAQSSAVSATTLPVGKPYTGTPVAIPGTFEAENFDLDGEGVAYHDNVAGNVSGQYRPSEDVDIIVSSDSAGGGYVVNNFETGEWLAYTVNVASSGNYDLELRVSSGLSNSAFHVEIDGVDATGAIVVPSTGGWNAFQWIGKKGVALTAGQHVLKVVADQQYFNLNSIRVVVPGGATPSPTPGSGKLLFRSGYEGAVTVAAPTSMYGTGGWQDIVGLDTTTGATWAPTIWGGTGRFQVLPDAPVTESTLSNYMLNRIETVTGRDGNPTRALYSQITQKGGFTQDPYMLLPAYEGGDLYISYWLKLQPDLVQKMTPGTWRALFEWKTAGDYRITVNINTYGNVQPYWEVRGDNMATGGAPFQVYWRYERSGAPVPVGRWFKFEVFWHRSGGSDGRVWVAVDGRVIADHRGPNMGVNNDPINRIMVHTLYSQSSLPIYQWIDDLEIWDGFSPDAAPH